MMPSIIMQTNPLTWNSIEYLIGAAVIVCLGALWKVYRKLARKAKR